MRYPVNQCLFSAVIPIVRFAGDQKTAQTGESLYYKVVAAEVIPEVVDQWSTFNRPEGYRSE